MMNGDDNDNVTKVGYERQRQARDDLRDAEKD